jgi:hypothetical protein
MTKEQAEALVAKKLPELKKLLCLDHVSFEFEYETTSDAPAEVSLSPDYNHAVIRFDPPSIKDDEIFLKHFFHELLHVVLMQFEGFYQHVVPELPVGHIQLVNRLSTAAQEQVVAHLEKILGRDR